MRGIATSSVGLVGGEDADGEGSGVEAMDGAADGLFEERC